jgi:hypothetical protein
MWKEITVTRVRPSLLYTVIFKIFDTRMIQRVQAVTLLKVVSQSGLMFAGT